MMFMFDWEGKGRHHGELVSHASTRQYESWPLSPHSRSTNKREKKNTSSEPNLPVKTSNIAEGPSQNPAAPQRSNRVAGAGQRALAAPGRRPELRSRRALGPLPSAPRKLLGKRGGQKTQSQAKNGVPTRMIELWSRFILTNCHSHGFPQRGVWLARDAVSGTGHPCMFCEKRTTNMQVDKPLERIVSFRRRIHSHFSIVGGCQS